MNLLTTFLQPAAGGTWNVFWRNGVHHQGIVKVTVAAGIVDPEIVAELSVLQWLLEHRSVFGVSQAGKGLCLTVSAGAIKKLAKAAEKDGGLRESGLGKPHLFPYARFLGTRFFGADISVSKDEGWILPRAENDLAELTIAEPLPEVLDIKGLGRVELRWHALTTFGNRQAAAEKEDLWRLLRRAAASGLRKASLRADRVSAQAARYGQAGDVWVNDELKWAFVVIPGNPWPVVVTSFAIKMSVANGN